MGGIMVNRGVGGDRFMPLLLQSRGKEDGTSKDLFEEAFGAAPDMSAALGSGLTSDDLFGYSIDSFKPPLYLYSIYVRTPNRKLVKPTVQSGSEIRSARKADDR